MRRNIQNQHGFTIVELLIVVPMALLIVTSFIVVLVSLTGDALANREQLVQARDTQGALDRIEQDIRLSNRFLAESRVAISSPQGVNNDTTKFVNASTTTGTALILQSLSTDKNPVDSTRNLVFLTNSPNPCGSVLVTSNSPHYVNIVYFVKNSTLYRRTLMTYNPSPAPCATPWQQPTCAIGLPNGTTCVSEDMVLATGVSNFTIDYYTDPSSTTPIADASDPSQTVAVRDDALVTAGSLRASITLAKTASGRDITFSGAARVAKLNSSSLDPPTTPTISSTISAPAQVTFSWGVVPNATSYVISYNINGGAWIDVPNGVSTTSYAINAYRKDVVNIRVAANNSAGTSPSGTASATIPAWTACDLQGTWVPWDGPVGGHADPAFTKTTANVVVLKGLVRLGTTGTICTLPPGYRPDKRLLFQAETGGGAVVRIDIDTNGNVIDMTAHSSWLNLSTIQFIPSGAYSWTDISLPGPAPAWQHYTVAVPDPNYPKVKVTKDSLNRAHIEGLFLNGTYTMGTNIFALPAGYTVSAHNIYGAGSQAFNDIQFSSDGYVKARGNNGNGFTGAQMLFYPSTITGWTAATLTGSPTPWSNYGSGFGGAEYRKDTDGIVSLRGLIKAGTVGQSMLTLPVGSRPSETIICDAVTSPDVPARIDINPDGTVVASEGAVNTWLSLAGCDFMSEQ